MQMLAYPQKSGLRQSRYAGADDILPPICRAAVAVHPKAGYFPVW